ncbi:uncharacterized protein LOC127281129 [Leptopilina boulardi]|uniref:uncharacterized protein LOC127281129 n=1 Tax=Leptopilina boulardi TaxID=63433 RepID=UPI0021F58BAE|nr:uncharacterized protein LOC127281129 [Leptopilina boulardi]
MDKQEDLEINKECTMEIYGKDEILFAIEEKNLEKLKKIFAYFENNKQNLISIIQCKHEFNYYDNCILLMALKTNNENILDLFLNKKLCDNDKNIQDFLIHKTIELNNIKMLNKLIERGFLDYKICNCKHQLSPLLELISMKRLNWIKRFYEAGVSFQEKTNENLPLLHFALKQRDIDKEFIKRLISYGAELSIKDSNTDMTPLHYLISNNVLISNRQKVKFIKILLKFGANPNCWSELKKEFILYTALEMNNHYAIKLLLMYGANVNCIEIISQNVIDEVKNNYSLNSSSLMCNLYFLQLESKNLLDNNENIDERLVKLLEILQVNKMLTEILKCRKIYNIDPWTILTANENKLTNLMKNSEIWTILILHMPLFARWYSIFKFLVKKGKEREILLNKCRIPFVCALKGKLNFYIVSEILNYLGRTDLRCLYTACCPNSCMERLVPKLYRLVYSNSQIHNDIRKICLPNILDVL